MREVGPVDRSRWVVYQNRTFVTYATNLDGFTFRCAHEGVDGSRQPTRHKPILHWDRRDLGVRQALGDKHQANRHSSDDIADEPSRIVPRKPSNNWNLLGNILRRCRWKSAGTFAGEPAYSSPIGIVDEVLLDTFHDFHDGSAGKSDTWKYSSNEEKESCRVVSLNWQG